MKCYDAQKIKNFIESKQDDIDNVDCGMQEDWFWTAQTVYENGDYNVDLSGKTVDIAGIRSSTWATPIMRVDYKNGDYEEVECYYDDGITPDPYKAAMQEQLVRASQLQ